MDRQGLWQKLSIDWPCAVTDWLYANSVAVLRESLKTMTLRRLIILAIFLMIATAFLEIASGDMILLAVGDATFYIEIASLFYIAVARNHLAQLFLPVRHKGRRMLRRMRLGRTRVRLQRYGARKSPPTDDGAAVWAFA